MNKQINNKHQADNKIKKLKYRVFGKKNHCFIFD